MQLSAHEQSSAELVMNHFLSSYVDEIQDLSFVPLSQTGLTKTYDNYQLNLTHFDDLYDTLLYSKLISQALTLNSEIEQIIDFGAGSSIPTLLALKETGHNARVVAVDIDPRALETSRRNASVLGLSDRYEYQLGSMEEFLEMHNGFDRQTLIVSNPPYIPAPEGLSDYHFLPVNGGEEGCRYIMNFLEHRYSHNTTLALFWGSLCSPEKVVSAMEHKFEILHAEAVRVHFGQYTSCPLIKDHLYNLREKGRVSFENTSQGEVQLVIGTVLRPLN